MSPRRKAGTCVYCRRPIAIQRQRMLRGQLLATLENLTCSARCLALYNLREANRRDSRRRLAAQAEARLSGRLCQICDAPIDPERVRRWKTVKTCSPACAAENRLAIVRRAVSRHRRRQRKARKAVAAEVAAGV